MRTAIAIGLTTALAAASCATAGDGETGVGISGATTTSAGGSGPSGSGGAASSSVGGAAGTGGATASMASSTASSGGAASGGAGGASSSSGAGGCFSYASDFDTAQAAAGWTAVNLPAASQWGQFGEHWDWGTPTSGPNDDHGGGGDVWAVGLAGRYTYFENSRLESPVWDLSGTTGAALTFWSWLQLEDCASSCGSGNPAPTVLDGAQVTCWDGTDWIVAPPTGGYQGVIRIFDTFDPLHPKKDEPGFRYTAGDPTYGAAWREITIDVPAACLRADAQIGFHFASDSSSASLNGQGWYIDDLNVQGYCN